MKITEPRCPPREPQNPVVCNLGKIGPASRRVTGSNYTQDEFMIISALKAVWGRNELVCTSFCVCNSRKTILWRMTNIYSRNSGNLIL